MGERTSFADVYPQYVHQWHPDNSTRPDTTPRSSNKKVLWLCDKNSQHTWWASPNSRFKANGDVRGCPYCTGVRVDVGVNDLKSLFPDVAEQWSVRNSAAPDSIHAYSNKKVWWTGDCGHEWEAAVVSRTKNNGGCPFCSGHRVLKGFNDLASTHPHLVKEWVDKRSADTVSAGSSYPARWRGQCGHEWEAPVRSRTRGNGCPFCAGIRVLKGFNDLASNRPELAAMWHPSNKKNSDDVTVGSSFRAKWVCPEGHITEMSVCDKASSSTLCSVCDGTVTVKGVTDFGSRFPDIAKQWVRGAKSPSEVRPMSSAKAVWRCCEGHEWEAPFSRRALGHGCPYCAGQRALPGVNDLASRFPALVKEWHPDNGVSPSQVASSSSRAFKWRCSEGHEWTVSPNQRTSHKEGVTGCPECWSKGRSSAEEAFGDFIASHYSGEVVRRHRIGRAELDLFLPELDLAFEFNGVYWHSEKCGRSKNSHRDKLRMCESRGITLIQVWEDDWRDRAHAVKKMVLRKIHADTSPRVGARATRVVSVNTSFARTFLEDNHIQGFAGGTHYDALRTSSGDIVAVMVTTHFKNHVRLDRYATSVIVPGGFTKLLKVVAERARGEGLSQIVTFSDNEISSGNLYSSNGFRKDRELDPDYKYLVNASRQHKFLFRKDRFKRDPSLKYEDGMSEQELAKVNNLHRVWDSGKVRWVLDL